ncbi:dimethylsulfonioproprionate lyase family protein [Shimia sediminis]|uniref:dimethylsulfonioproprionate lyase family protein n=1 Tax=Shimia sediminis TaxID=2497945 RepID=UPI000F8F545C|nr:dimethylsulfonioproprionate lyase family protein [Shimia sediminis]
MTHPAFQTLLQEFRVLHGAEPALQAFCDLPEVLTPQEVIPHHIPAATLMEEDPNLSALPSTAALRDAFIAASPVAQWRETYKGTRMGADFMQRFACYCLIGGGGPFAAPEMGAYVVYMPPGLYYPYHHHPAEEIYYILAGEAEFLMDGAAPKTLGAGSHVFHPSNRPHATQTHETPFMALVLWRGDMGVKPVLTYPEGDR